MRLKYLTAATLGIVLASPAAAQIAGPRAEVRAGYDSVAAKVKYDDGVDSFKVEEDDESISYGIELGYDYAIGSQVIGAYAGVDLTGAKQCGELFGEDEVCLKARRNFTVGLRAGIAPSANTLIYVKGGYSNGRIKATYEDFEDILESASDSSNRGGYHIGAGFEANVSSKIYAKAEYVHTDYKDFGIDEDTRGDFSRDQVSVGLGLRF